MEGNIVVEKVKEKKGAGGGMPSMPPGGGYPGMGMQSHDGLHTATFVGIVVGFLNV